MAKSKSRLGRGLSSLLDVSEAPAGAGEGLAETPLPPPDASLPSASATDGELFHVELSRVTPNPHQPRRNFDAVALQGLADSLKNAGLIQPIVVREVAGGYELVAGERRWRAAQLAGLIRLPAVLRRVDAQQQAELALIENIHRADLNPIERAMAYRTLLDQLGHTQEELALRLGEDRSTIANHLRLLDLCEPARQHVVTGNLTLGHAKLLAGVHDLLQQKTLADRAVSQQLTVRNLEQLIRSGRVDDQETRPVPTAHIADLERRLSRDLQMRVQVRQTGKKGRGRLVIHYGSLDQFDELLVKLGIRSGE
jgi:ParB family chromosome partitioning protein